MDSHHKYGIGIGVMVLVIISAMFLLISFSGEGEPFEGVFDGIPILGDLGGKPQEYKLPETPEIETDSDKTSSSKASSKSSEPVNVVIISDKTKKKNNNILTNNEDTKVGISWYNKLNFEEATKAFEKSKDEDPVALFYLGLIMSYDDNERLSQNYFKKVAENGTYPELIKNAKTVLEAYDVFSKYKDGKVDFLYTLLGKAYININQSQLGILKLKQAVQMTPNYNDAWILLGTAYILAENYDKAEEALKNVTNSSRPEPSYYLGLASFNSGNYKQAILAYQNCLLQGYEPQAEAYIQIGESYLAIENYEEAMNSYTKAIALEPNTVEHYQKAIWLQINIFGDINYAFRIASKAISENSTSPLAHNLVAEVSILNDDFSTAKQYLDSAMSLNKDFALTWYNYGKYFEKQSDLEQSKLHYTKSISLDKGGNVARLASDALQRL